MDTRIRDLLRQIASLEDDLRTALHERETRVQFTIRGKRVEFEREARRMHARLKRNFFRWLATDRPQNLITGPIIYGMAIPLGILDLFITLYQATCFRVYGITKVRRGDYIVFDRHHLGYLNFIERFHCEYCAYANGLVAYAMEIVGRTEQYFCPIKHACRIVGVHGHYTRFLEFGDSEEFHDRLEDYRIACGQLGADHPPPP